MIAAVVQSLFHFFCASPTPRSPKVYEGDFSPEIGEIEYDTVLVVYLECRRGASDAQRGDIGCRASSIKYASAGGLNSNNEGSGTVSRSTLL